MNVDLAGVDGTGPQGVVTDDDVEAHVESLAEGAGAARTVAESRPLTGVQQVVSDRLSESAADAVHVTLNRSFDVSAIEDVLAAAKSFERSGIYNRSGRVPTEEYVHRIGEAAVEREGET